MTAPPPRPAVATCSRKRRYPDEFTARAGAMHAVVNDNLPALYIYRCKICRGWHLTRQNHGRKRKITATDLVLD